MRGRNRDRVEDVVKRLIVTGRVHCMYIQKMAARATTLLLLSIVCSIIVESSLISQPKDHYL